MKRRYCLAILLLVTILVFVAPGAKGSTVEIEVNAPKSAKPGDLVTNVFTVKNTGGASDTYDLSLSSPTGWSVLGSVPASLNLNPGDKQKFFITVIVPKTAVAKEYEVTLTAESQTVLGDEAEAKSTVSISAIPKVDAEWVREPPRTEPGGSSTGIFSLTNSGNVSDVYTIEVDTNNCDVNLADNRVQVFPGETKRIEVNMSLPKSLSPGSEYSFYLEISSRKHPDVTARLRHSNSAAPPPPEEVGGTVYPLWPVTVSLSGGEDGSVSLGISGSGELGDIGSLSASTTITPAEFQKPTGSFSSDDWSLSLGGGGISGGFGGVSSSETAVSLYNQFEDSISTQLTLAREVIGASGRINWEGGSLRAVGGSDDDDGYQFGELQVSHDFPGPFSITGGIGNVSTQTESGTAFVVSPAIEGEKVSLVGSYRVVPDNFPESEGVRDYGLSLSFSGEVPLNLAAGLTREDSTEEGVEITTSTTAVEAATSFPLSSDIDLDLGGLYESEKSDDTPPSTDIVGMEVEAAVSGSFGEENDYSLGLNFAETDDFVSDQSFLEAEVTASLGLNLDPVGLEFAVGLAEVINGNTGEIESESSTFSIDISSPRIAETLDMSLALGETATWTVGFSRPIQDTGELTGSFTVPFSADGSFSISLSATTPTIFGFLGPTKGRVKGRAFIDENGNGEYDGGEEPVTDLLLTLTEVIEQPDTPEEEGTPGIFTFQPQPEEKQAITGENGKYAFWPVEPDEFELDVGQVPFGLALQKETPLKLKVEAGQFIVPLPFKRYSAISGIVYNDKNQNKKMEPEEERMSGVEVLIQGPGGPTRVKTGPSGRFVARVDPGSYTVTLLQNTLPERFVPTTPGELSFTVEPQQTKEIEFGTYQEPKEVIFTFGPPEAKLTYSPEKPMVGEEVTFDASRSEGVGDEIVSYLWKFVGDQDSFTAQGEKVQVTFPSSGKWEVTLTVKDESNMSSKKTVTLDVSE